MIVLAIALAALMLTLGRHRALGLGPAGSAGCCRSGPRASASCWRRRRLDDHGREPGVLDDAGDPHARLLAARPAPDHPLHARPHQPGRARHLPRDLRLCAPDPADRRGHERRRGAASRGADGPAADARERRLADLFRPPRRRGDPGRHGHRRDQRRALARGRQALSRRSGRARQHRRSRPSSTSWRCPPGSSPAGAAATSRRSMRARCCTPRPRTAWCSSSRRGPATSSSPARRCCRSGRASSSPRTLADELGDPVVVGPKRTSTQDIDFATNVLVEIALRALSPGINDPRTAISCLDRLAQALVEIIRLPEPPALVADGDGTLRLIVRPGGLRRRARGRPRPDPRGRPRPADDPAAARRGPGAARRLRQNGAQRGAIARQASVLESVRRRAAIDEASGERVDQALETLRRALTEERRSDATPIASAAAALQIAVALRTGGACRARAV